MLRMKIQFIYTHNVCFPEQQIPRLRFFLRERRKKLRSE